MKSYKMSEAETQDWEQEDAAKRDAARHEIRERARTHADPEFCEIVSQDGIVLDVVQR